MGVCIDFDPERDLESRAPTWEGCEQEWERIRRPGSGGIPWDRSDALRLSRRHACCDAWRRGLNFREKRKIFHLNYISSGAVVDAATKVTGRAPRSRHTHARTGPYAEAVFRLTGFFVGRLAQRRPLHARRAVASAGVRQLMQMTDPRASSGHVTRTPARTRQHLGAGLAPRHAPSSHLRGVRRGETRRCTWRRKGGTWRRWTGSSLHGPMSTPKLRWVLQ